MNEQDTVDKMARDVTAGMLARTRARLLASDVTEEEIAAGRERLVMIVTEETQNVMLRLRVQTLRDARRMGALAALKKTFETYDREVLKRSVERFILETRRTIHG